MESVNIAVGNRIVSPQAVVLLDPATGTPFAAIPTSGGLTDAQLRASLVKTDPLGIPAVARQLTATTTSANTALTTTCRRISIKARNADMRFSIGAVAQTASATASHFIELGERLDLAVPANANIAVIRDSLAVADGTLCISELS